MICTICGTNDTENDDAICDDCKSFLIDNKDMKLF